jgi:hypothetical protein
MLSLFAQAAGNNNNVDPAAVAGGSFACMAGFGLLYLALIVFVFVCWWKIFERTGHGGAMSLLLLVPFVNLYILYMLAFKPWPAFEGQSKRRSRAEDEEDEDEDRRPRRRRDVGDRE